MEALVFMPVCMYGHAEERINYVLCTEGFINNQSDCHAGRSGIIFADISDAALSVSVPAEGSGACICGKRRIVQGQAARRGTDFRLCVYRLLAAVSADHERVCDLLYSFVCDDAQRIP